MKAIAEKLRASEAALADQHGDFRLFALFLRDEAPGVWDLVVAADWIQPDKAAALRSISNRVQNDLSAQELTKLARIVIVDPGDAAVQAVTSALAVNGGPTLIKDSNFFGLEIKEAWVITARGPKAA